MVESGAEQTAPVGLADEAPRWRLTRGVGLLCGTALGDAQRLGQTAYLLVAPSGRRYEVTEPLYRLAELLAGGGTAEQLAARLGARLQRPIGTSDVQRLVDSKLVQSGLAIAESAPLAAEPIQQSRGEAT